MSAAPTKPLPSGNDCWPARPCVNARATKLTKTGCASCAIAPMSSTTSTNAERRVVAVTSGEPAGIGPDICLALAHADLPVHVRVLGDRTLLAQRAERLGVDIAGLDIEHVALRAPCTPGRLDPSNSCYVLDLL